MSDRPQIPKLLGTHEVAKMLGWSRGKVSVYLYRGILPEPVDMLHCGPIWTIDQIEEFKAKLTEKEKGGR
jgi:hypothetical protein